MAPSKLIWARREPFNPLSRDQVLAYCYDRKYPVPKDRKTKRPTVNDEALEKLSLRFPEDKILSGVRRSRAISKARGYLKGTYLGKDDRFHSQFINVPETGRLSAKSPYHEC